MVEYRGSCSPRSQLASVLATAYTMAKTFFKDGKWIDSPRAAIIVKCTCGNKYIKTREGQTQCLACLSTRQYA